MGETSSWVSFRGMVEWARVAYRSVNFRETGDVAPAKKEKSIRRMLDRSDGARRPCMPRGNGSLGLFSDFDPSLSELIHSRTLSPRYSSNLSVCWRTLG